MKNVKVEEESVRLASPRKSARGSCRLEKMFSISCLSVCLSSAPPSFSLLCLSSLFCSHSSPLYPLLVLLSVLLLVTGRHEETDLNSVHTSEPLTSRVSASRLSLRMRRVTGRAPRPTSRRGVMRSIRTARARSGLTEKWVADAAREHRAGAQGRTEGGTDSKGRPEHVFSTLCSTSRNSETIFLGPKRKHSGEYLVCQLQETRCGWFDQSTRENVPKRPLHSLALW